MKSLFRQLALIILLGAASSCAFFNEKTVDLSINSNPPGADIFIEGRNFGRTPATFKIVPDEYVVTLSKEGYGSTNFKTDIWWGTIRTDVNGERTGDGTRCFLDMMTLIFSFNSWNRERCGDFKQKQYLINIPNLGPNSGRAASSNSMMGVGQTPADMVNYYYNQDMGMASGYSGAPAEENSNFNGNGGNSGNRRAQQQQNSYGQQYNYNSEQYRNSYPR